MTQTGADRADRRLLRDRPARRRDRLDHAARRGDPPIPSGGPVRPRVAAGHIRGPRRAVRGGHDADRHVHPPGRDTMRTAERAEAARGRPGASPRPQPVSAPWRAVSLAASAHRRRCLRPAQLRPSGQPHLQRPVAEDDLRYSTSLVPGHLVRPYIYGPGRAWDSPTGTNGTSGWGAAAAVRCTCSPRAAGRPTTEQVRPRRTSLPTSRWRGAAGAATGGTRPPAGLTRPR